MRWLRRIGVAVATGALLAAPVGAHADDDTEAWGAFRGAVAAGGVHGNLDVAGMWDLLPAYAVNYYACATADAVLTCGPSGDPLARRLHTSDRLVGAYTLTQNGSGWLLSSRLTGYRGDAVTGEYDLACDITAAGAGTCTVI